MGGQAGTGATAAPTHGSHQLVYGRTDQQGQPVVEQVNFNGSTGYVEHDPVTRQPLMLRTSNGIQTLYVSDGTGNPVALLTDYSTQSYAYKYDPYGTAVLTTGGGNVGTQQNPYLFKGGIQDRTTGWVHFGARWYDHRQMDTTRHPRRTIESRQREPVRLRWRRPHKRERPNR